MAQGRVRPLGVCYGRLCLRRQHCERIDDRNPLLRHKPCVVEQRDTDLVIALVVSILFFAIDPAVAERRIASTFSQWLDSYLVLTTIPTSTWET